MTADDELADMIRDIALDVLGRVGDDANARYEFFKRFVELAQSIVSAHPTPN